MEIVHRCCCGLDVHAKTVVACLIKEDGGKEVRTFSTMTDDLLRLGEWLGSHGCSDVAMESTGVYWKPVFNILEEQFKVMLVNARHVKAVPGRKTDVRDCEWLADLLRHGLLKGSFIPPREIRELRELTRYRKSLIEEQGAVANRVQKLIESGNIKLAQVASDALGASGRAMLRALAAGETDVEKMAELARQKMQRKKPELRRALQGRLNQTQRWVLGELLNRYEELESAIARVSAQIRQQGAANPDPRLAQAIQNLPTIPGIGERIAETIIAEIGVDMSRFPTDHHLCSWAGMCPGNNESAGKRKSTKTNPANPYLRPALVQAAWAASHTKTTYLSAQYHKLVRRIGKKKALVAVGHSILIVVYHVLLNQTTYHELGVDYFDRLNRKFLKNKLVRRLESLGLKVTIEEAA